MSKKPWYKSKTVWVNGASFVAATIAAWTNEPIVQQNPQIALKLTGILAALNLVMRFVTDKPIGKEE